jgi:hypothetical protein
MEGFQGEGNDLCGVGRWEGVVLYEKTLYYIIFRIGETCFRHNRGQSGQCASVSSSWASLQKNYLIPPFEERVT